MSKSESFKTKAEREKQAISWFVKNKLKKENKKLVFSETKNEYESFDGWLCSGSTEFVIEIKVRTEYTAAKIDGYGGAFLEKMKLDGINDYRMQHKDLDRVLYFNFYKDELRIYELSTNIDDYEWITKMLPKDNYDKKLIPKLVTKLSNKYLIEKISYKN